MLKNLCMAVGKFLAIFLLRSFHEDELLIMIRGRDNIKTGLETLLRPSR